MACILIPIAKATGNLRQTTGPSEHHTFETCRVQPLGRAIGAAGISPRAHGSTKAKAVGMTGY